MIKVLKDRVDALEKKLNSIESFVDCNFEVNFIFGPYLTVNDMEYTYNSGKQEILHKMKKILDDKTDI